MSVQRKRIQPDKLFVRGGVQPLYSHVMSVSGTGRMVFIAGQVARDSQGNTVGKGDMRAQMEQVGENIKACLEAAGGSLSDLVQTTTFVTDIDEYFKHPDVRGRYFGTALPTSAAIEVRRLASLDMMIEVQSIAIIDG